MSKKILLAAREGDKVNNSSKEGDRKEWIILYSMKILQIVVFPVKFSDCTISQEYCHNGNKSVQNYFYFLKNINKLTVAAAFAMLSSLTTSNWTRCSFGLMMALRSCKSINITLNTEY